MGQKGKTGCDFTALIFVMFIPTKGSRQPLAYFSSELTPPILHNHTNQRQQIHNFALDVPHLLIPNHIMVVN